MTRFLPKLRIEPWRRAAYLDAWIEARRERPKLTLADWMREALDSKCGSAPQGDIQFSPPKLRVAAGP